MSEKYLRKMMAENGEIKKDIDSTIFGQKKKSRGYYITIPGSMVWYLHHDGIVKHGVHAGSERPAFWQTREEAQDFFGKWRSEVEND